MNTRLYSYTLQTKHPLYKTRSGLLLETESGWGEAAPLPGFSKESFHEAAEELLALLPHLSSKKATCPSVRFAISSAQLPFPTKICAPLTNLIAPGSSSSLKLKLGERSLNEALALVKNHLQTHRLRLDFNGKWPLSQLLQFAEHFAPETFEYLEEPLSSLPDLLFFSQKTHFPIAIDESFRKKEKAPYLEIPSLKAVIIKPTLTGEIPTLPAHLSLILSSSFESSVGLLQIARHASHHPLGLDTFKFFAEDLLTPPLQEKEGFLHWEGGGVRKDLLCLIAKTS